MAACNSSNASVSKKKKKFVLWSTERWNYLCAAAMIKILHLPTFNNKDHKFEEINFLDWNN